MARGWFQSWPLFVGCVPNHERRPSARGISGTGNFGFAPFFCARSCFLWRSYRRAALAALVPGQARKYTSVPGPESSSATIFERRAPKEFHVTMSLSSTRYKLRLAGAFAALVTLALAVSCKGFFVNPTVTSIV